MADVGPWEDDEKRYYLAPDEKGARDAAAFADALGWAVYAPGRSSAEFASGKETGQQGRDLADEVLAAMLRPEIMDVRASYYVGTSNMDDLVPVPPVPEGSGGATAAPVRGPTLAAVQWRMSLPLDVVVHGPQDDGGWLLCNDQDRTIGRLNAGTDVLADLIFWGRHDLGVLSAALAAAEARAERAERALATLIEAATDVYVLACETDQIGPDYDRSEHLLGTLSNAIDLARSGGPL